MTMDFRAFAEDRGLIIDRIVAGRWVRVPTKAHPRKRNGAYFFDGDYAHLRAWDTMDKTETWMARRESKPDPELALRMAASRAQAERERREGWEKASRVAQALIAGATLAEHDYLRAKGFPHVQGLVGPNGALLIPMRDVANGTLLGVQRIQALGDGSFEKKMLPGMRAKGAVYRLGPPRSPETHLVEGYATGLSVDAALAQMRLRASVLVCFSAGNLVEVANRVAGTRYVAADNDASGTGEEAARKTGLPYMLPDVVGEDFNDVHVRHGIFAVRAKIVELRRSA